jgi:hypothetical protein
MNQLAIGLSVLLWIGAFIALLARERWLVPAAATDTEDATAAAAAE